MALKAVQTVNTNEGWPAGLPSTWELFEWTPSGFFGGLEQQYFAGKSVATVVSLTVEDANPAAPDVAIEIKVTDNISFLPSGLADVTKKQSIPQWAAKILLALIPGGITVTGNTTFEAV